MEDEKHFPPGAEPETPVEEPKPETEEAPQEKPKAEPEAKPEGELAKPEKDEAAKPEGEEEPQSLPKKRSIYDDLKDRKQQAKDATARADAAEAKAAELQALLDTKNDAKTPEEKSEAADDLKSFAEAEGLSVDGLEKLVGIISKRIPAPENPMSKEEVDAWRASHAAAKQADEDREILSAAPSIKTQFDVHDDAELQNIMKEVVKLAHTPEFHDKEVEYIVWKNRDQLSKLVSPKKASFESGSPSRAEGKEEKIDYSSGRVTPEQVSDALSAPKPSYEIRRSQ